MSVRIDRGAVHADEMIEVISPNDPRYKLAATTMEPGREMSFGGGIEGAEQTSRETMRWTPTQVSPDLAINVNKPMADARARDTAINDGYIYGAVSVHRDSVVGSNFRLVARPNYRVIGADEGWALEYIDTVESLFNLAAESESCWFDASRSLTFTGLVRLVVAAFVYTGEHLSFADYITESDRPFATAIQLLSPDRLSNPNGAADGFTGRISGNKRTQYRRGVERDFRGKAVQYWIQDEHPSETTFSLKPATWSNIPAQLPWGRQQIIFLKEPMQIDQTRGLSEMVAALKHSRMTRKFSEITLQNAVINASYAAAIESEMPTPELVTALGGGGEGFDAAIGLFLSRLQEYLGSANVAIDGAKIPHFFPGTKLNMKPMGTPGGIGTEFEASLLRRISATLGVSYAELSRDFSKVSYSAARAEMATTGRSMTTRKRMIADRFANSVYQLWLEEQMSLGNLPLPTGRNRTDFYRPMMKEAYSRCSWIGSGKGQIDELKETQAAIMRINAGLSDWGIECARLGLDYREVFEAQKTQRALADKLGITFDMTATKQTIRAVDTGQEGDEPAPASASGTGNQNDQ